MMKKDLNISQNTYKQTLLTLKQRINTAQYRVFTKVNQELLSLYWDIGKKIIENQEKEGWGKSIVNKLSQDLQKEFEGIRGFSPSSLWRMRTYYKTYSKNIKLATLSREIGWSQNILIFEKCKDDQQKEFYLQITNQQSLSTRKLNNKIKDKNFEKWAINQSNFSQTLPSTDAIKGQIVLKDEYNLDFLGITENTKEKVLEENIMQNIDQFMKEFGGHLMFAGRQYKLRIDRKEYYLDLLFYHKTLRTYIIIELKTGEFKSEYTSKMALYLNAVEDQLVDKKHDKQAIGIILCKRKDRTIVDLSLKVIARPIGVATYKTYDIETTLPKQWEKYIPSKEIITKKLLSLY